MLGNDEPERRVLRNKKAIVVNLSSPCDNTPELSLTTVDGDDDDVTSNENEEIDLECKDSFSDDEFDTDRYIESPFKAPIKSQQFLGKGDLRLAPQIVKITAPLLPPNSDSGCVAREERLRKRVPERLYSQLQNILEVLQCLQEKDNAMLTSKDRTNWIPLSQGIMTPQERFALIQWLTEVCFEYRCRRKTLHLTIAYIDAYITMKLNEFGQAAEYEIHELRGNLQLVGSTMLLLASEQEEIMDFLDESAVLSWVTNDTNMAPMWQYDEMHRYSCLAEMTKQEYLVKCETVIATPFDFLEVFYQILSPVVLKGSFESFGEMDKSMEKAFLQDIAILDVLAATEMSLNYSCAVLAASVMWISACKKTPADRDTVLLVTGMRMQDLEECVTWIENTLAVVSVEEVQPASYGVFMQTPLNSADEMWALWAGNITTHANENFESDEQGEHEVQTDY